MKDEWIKEILYIYYIYIIYIYIYLYIDFPGGSDGKVSAYNVGHPGSVSELGSFSWRREWEFTPVFLPPLKKKKKRMDKTNMIYIYTHTCIYKKDFHLAI